MYTGTMIRDLMATVERAEQGARLQQIAEELELQRLYDLQMSSLENEQIFAGAA